MKEIKVLDTKTNTLVNVKEFTLDEIKNMKDGTVVYTAGGPCEPSVGNTIITCKDGCRGLQVRDPAGESVDSLCLYTDFNKCRDYELDVFYSLPILYSVRHKALILWGDENSHKIEPGTKVLRITAHGGPSKKPEHEEMTIEDAYEYAIEHKYDFSVEFCMSDEL